MKLRHTIGQWLVLTFATMIIAASVFFFLMPSNLAISSISGLAIILAKLFPMSVSAINLILNASLLVVGFLFIGRSFGIKTVYTSILIPVFVGVLERIFPEGIHLTEDALLDMVCYCFFVSIGVAILFYYGASSGGLDIIGKLLNKFLRIEIGRAISLAGLCIAVASIFVYDVKTALISILGTYFNGIMLDHFIFGATLKKRVCIVSQKTEQIKAFILHTLHSGATIYTGRGAYTDLEQEEIITIVDKNEYLKLMNYLADTDPDAFVTVYTVNSIIYKPKVH